MPTRPAGPVSQDWEPVVLHKTKPKATVLRDSKSIHQAIRAGAQVQTVKKHDGGTNKKAPATAVYARKLDEAEQPAAIDRVATEMMPILTYQGLFSHVDGSLPPPSPLIRSNDKEVANPDYAQWVKDEQQAIILLNASLTEEAFSVTIGLTSARDIWVALEAAFCNASVERVQNLRDNLRALKKGEKSVAEFGRAFKAICDQLSAIGHPVDSMDQLHWFLCGLGTSFESFSTTTRSVRPIPNFVDLLASAESHEMFMKNLHGSVDTPTVAFTAQTGPQRPNTFGSSYRPQRSQQAQFRPNRPTFNNYRGSNRQFGRQSRPPTCQLCRKTGHYANQCYQLSTYAATAPSPDQVAQAFHAQCQINSTVPDWTSDTGATTHMLPNNNNLQSSTPTQGNQKVYFGNGQSLPITHIGQTKLFGNLALNNVLVVPNLTKNLLSIGKLTEDNLVDVVFSHPYFYIQDRRTKQTLARGCREDGLYVLRQPHEALVSTSTCPKASFELWHSRLGHVNFDIVSLLKTNGCLSFTSVLPKPGLCSPCELAKAKRQPFSYNNKRASLPLEIIHCDLWGPSPIKSVDNFVYYVAFIDDYSRFTWLYPLRAKSDFFNALSIFVPFVQTQFSTKIKVFQSDGGTEFTNNRVRILFEQNGTQHRMSCPYTPQQNGRVERKHRHVVETGLAMLFNAKLPTKYWVDAFSSAVFIINRLPSPILQGKSPFELLYHQIPNYAMFRTFGCRVFPCLRDYAPHKLSPRSIPCIFLGYCSKYKGYRCFDPCLSRIYITRSARFDENNFPFDGLSIASKPLDMLDVTTFLDVSPISTNKPTTNVHPHPIRPTVPTSSQINPPLTVPFFPANSLGPTPAPAQPDTNVLPSNPSSLSGADSFSGPGPTSDIPPYVSSGPTVGPAPTGPVDPLPPVGPISPQTDHVESSTTTSPTSSPNVTPPISPQAPPNPPPLPSHPMMTRAKSGIFKIRHRVDLAHTDTIPLHRALFANGDPTTFHNASKDTKWVKAMEAELQALNNNNTWILVPRPNNVNVVGSKWIYRTKFRSDGSIERYKARLVAQGYSQVPGLDYTHTFSPVVKATTVRTVLALSVIHNWHLHQLDVNNAFLHGHLTEDVYMEQPKGFISSQFPSHVCKLNKAIYGLKQAPRAWFHRLSLFLLNNGFSCSRADPSLFIYKRGSCIMYLLVYVDDLILTGNDSSTISSFISYLNKEFAIKDLGKLNYFLGLEVTYTQNGIFVNQSKYALDILTRAKMLDAKPAPTPLSTNVTFVSTGTMFSDATLYRSIVGALQYLTITRPDIAYAVNQVSQFLHAPTTDHFQEVKRILRYLKGTIAFGLHYNRPTSTSLIGYSDADWARCIETRRSTYGYSIFLGGNLISWSAKKQPTVARSSCESEYRAMANTAAEIVWLTHLLQELHALPPDRPTILCDNQSAIFLTQNPVAHKRAKHIDLDYHFLRELVTAGKLATKFVPTKLQVADIFTKSLPSSQFVSFRHMLRVGPPPFSLQGDLIQKSRIEKKLSQADLAKQINERPQVVQEYENGKAVPNQMVLAKMERVLGVKLRGKIHK
ncbi:putative RNA-directed DNA polymerase transcription factor Lambda-DB family [Helianthus annuus]|nr:putative RNA-directed DNA polymerase transcription factor Lambda-DB family [Helianthus annuus]